MPLKIICWNVNSINQRIDYLIELINENNPDIILLQEIKCTTEKFPYEKLSEFSYNLYILGEKSYNGVSILSKFPADEIFYTFTNNPIPHQSRFIEIACNTPLGYVRLVSLYAPNGSEIGSEKFKDKLEFYDHLMKYIVKKNTFDEKFIIGGDFNIAPFDIDVSPNTETDNLLCFTQIEREKFRAILNSGFNDFFRVYLPESKQYSWWNYRARSFEYNKGLRIDTIIGNGNATDSLVKCEINYDMRKKNKPSDHAPVIAYLAKK